MSLSLSEVTWQKSLSQAIRDPKELISRLKLPENLLKPAMKSVQLFPLMVPESYLNRMEPGNPEDPLLKQILPLELENETVQGFSDDAVGDLNVRHTPGLLHKYQGRALLMVSGACAVHCRYCFRRHYPYGEEPRTLAEWEPVWEALHSDTSIQEIILSGGDPLLLTDIRLQELCKRISEIPHVKRLRIHSRLPVVLPDRIHAGLLELFQQLTAGGVIVWMVIHANHPNEIAGDAEIAIRNMLQAGIPTLNQTVLLKGINDNADTLVKLSEKLINLGVVPYYLHQLDRVTGVAHFEVAEEQGRALVRELRTRLPGYAVPQYVREIAGESHKISLLG
ncbi:MAG: EF-P beta-lysylation protein EpmB [Planctomycetes bacterium]|nr:EF-P beta-lysylation protein EpmB [Planctomycetota bacterium]MCH9726324.1 EF-P beta-lysylation protein EpmB [Planctomycetota bacterium]MCH9776398.1 EF-P beta-lysylation protein EpmB [Planctomycetota bacterium]MCH9790539.1 EF-P beta-lysylation protein EpmB [Planctomycetota bacterium]MDF1744821.1 EF-P beta-lysylation protein EpmB [Gimesia sp.]